MITRGQAGYAMAALLVAVAVMGIFASVALPVWTHTAKRERETELVFRGEQYIRALRLYQRQNVGAFPSDLETLVDGRFLRRLYPDPMSEGGDGKFRLVYKSELDNPESPTGASSGTGKEESTDLRVHNIRQDEERSTSELSQAELEEGGVVGVASTSEETSIRVYNGQRQYSKWVFIHTAATTQINTGPNLDLDSTSGMPRTQFSTP